MDGWRKMVTYLTQMRQNSLMPSKDPDTKKRPAPGPSMPTSPPPRHHGVAHEPMKPAPKSKPIC